MKQDFEGFSIHSQESLSGPEALLPEAAFSFKGYSFLGPRRELKILRPSANDPLFRN